MLPTSQRLRRTNRIVLAALTALLPLSIWQAALWAKQEARTEIAAEADAKLELYRANLAAGLKEFEYLPITLAADPIIQRLIDAPNEATVEAASQYLAKVQARSGVSDLYFMNETGLTIAHASPDGTPSFVGRNFQFRPYFQQAAAGETGRYFALGTTSRLPGYFISHPVRKEGHIRGVMVAKVSLAPLERRWSLGAATVLVADENGVVIVATEPEWKFHTTQPLPDAVRRRLQATRKYSEAELTPLPVTALPFPAGGGLPSTFPGETPISYLVHGTDLTSHDWRLHLLVDQNLVVRAGTDAGVMAALAHLLIIGLVHMWLQRRRNLMERLEMQEWARRELERQVRVRTADLMETNKQLAREITEREEAEQALKDTQAELVQAGKLAALGQMSAGIAHEVNQPLTAIRTFAENGVEFAKRGRHDIVAANLGKISDLTQRMGKITGHLKSFARRGEVSLQPVAVADVVDDAINLLRAGGRLKRSKVRIDGREPDLYVMAEPTQLQQVLVNLITNAADAMRPVDDPRMTVTLSQTDGRIRIDVADTGAGIAAEDYPKIFDPFFTTKPTGDGLGLGLSICYGIIKSFGGRITAAPAPDGGTIMTVELTKADMTIERDSYDDRHRAVR